MPDIERGKTAAEQIHDQLAADIAEGRLTEGQRVPSARELAEEWQVSPATGARALGLLAAGKLVTQGPRGTFVAAPRLLPGPQARYRLTGGRIPGEMVRVMAAGLVNLAEHPRWRYVADVLGVEPTPHSGIMAVVRREEIRYDNDGQAVLLQVEWVPARFLEACPELGETQPLPFAGGSIALIEARTGRKAARGRESHEARQPQLDGREIEGLALPLVGDGSAVLGQVWVWYDSAGAPLCYTEQTIREGRVIESEFSVSPAEIR